MPRMSQMGDRPQSNRTPPGPPPGSAAPAPPAPAGAAKGRTIAGAALLLMVFFVLSRLTGLLRDVVIAAQFDLSPELDAYQAAFRIPDLLFETVAGGALGSAFIPTFATTLAHSGRGAAWLLFSRVLNWTTLILVALAAVAALFALPLVQLIIGPQFPLAQQQLTAELMGWLLWSTVIFGASGLIMGALNAMHHFLLPAAAPLVRNLAMVVAAWLFAPDYGIYSLVIGAIVGAGGHLLVQLPGLYQRRATYRFDFTWRDPGVWEVARLMGPRVGGLFFIHLNFIVNTALASGLAAGSLSALTYAWRLMLLPLGIFAQAVGIAAFPTFAAQVAAAEHQAMRQTFGQLLRLILFVTTPAAVGLILLGEPLVQILFERGEFTRQSTLAITYALQFYAVGLVAHAAVEIIVRAYYALHDTVTPVAVGIATMLLNIGLSLWWVQLLSYAGLALANSVATGLEMVLLLWLLQRRMGGIDLHLLLPSVVRSGGAAACMGIGLWFWLRWLASGTLPAAWSTGGWLAGGGGLLLALLIYLGACLLLRHPELQAAVALVRRRRRPAAAPSGNAV